MRYLKRFSHLLELRKLSKGKKEISCISYLLMYESVFALRYILATRDYSCNYEEYRRQSIRDAFLYRAIGMD